MVKLPFKGLLCLFAAIAALLLLGCGKESVVARGETLLVSTEWGAKAGKFGLAIPAEGEAVGPRTFAIDEAGRIHIFDSIKRNIKVYDESGAYQGSVGRDLPGYSFVFYKAHYYLLDGESVHQYTLSGMPATTFPISRDLTLYEGYGQWMRIDRDGNLYIKSQGKTYRICEGVGEADSVLSGEQQVASGRRGTPDGSGRYWFTLTKENPGRFRLAIHDKRASLIKEFPVETPDAFGSVIFLDRDEKGIIHLETQRIEEDGTVRLEVRRYREDGRLVEIVALPNRYYTVVYKKVALGRKGSLYQLQTTPQGVRIVKWSK